jgi:hypothetical protein
MSFHIHVIDMAHFIAAVEWFFGSNVRIGGLASYGFPNGPPGGRRVQLINWPMMVQHQLL